MLEKDQAIDIRQIFPDLNPELVKSLLDNPLFIMRESVLNHFSMLQEELRGMERQGKDVSEARRVYGEVYHQTIQAFDNELSKNAGQSVLSAAHMVSQGQLKL